MAASPLTAALMAGGQGGETASMFGMDPNLMAAQPDIQLGQALIRGGLNSGPASPWEALARVAQTGAGALIQHSAISDLAKAYSGSAEHMAQVIDQVSPGSIIPRMLRSDDPVVRAQGMQLVQKGALQINEPHEVKPGGEVGQPGVPGPLIANTQPRDKVAIAVQDATRMQPTNPAGADAVARGITKDTTMEGGYRPPPTGIPTAPPAMSPPGIPAAPPRVGPPPVPSAAVPPPQPGRGNAFAPGETPMPLDTKVAQASPPRGGTLPGYAGAQATVAGAKAGAEETGKNNANFGPLLQPPGPIQPGPGTTEPIKTAAGTMIPPVKEQGPVPTNPAQLKEALPAWQKKETDWNASLGPSQQAEQRLQTIAGAFKQIETGSFQTNKAAVAAGLKAIGINLPDSVLSDPAQVQLALHENYVETLQQLKASTPRFTQMEFKALSGNKEHPDLQPSANLQMLSEDIGTLRQARDLPADFTAAKAHGWVNPQSFESSWLKANPLSGYVDKVRGEIGPLKGMPGFQGATPRGAYVWDGKSGIAPK